MAAFTDVEALVFDVFGTVVDWRGSLSRQLAERHGLPSDVVSAHSPDWDALTVEWRHGYYARTKSIAEGGSGSTNVDVLHREILDSILETPRWSYLAKHWDNEKRGELILFWHKLDGWPDTVKGLYSLKKQFILGTLSNGSARLLVDMARHADLPWDIVFSGDLLGSYKPNPKMYQGAAEKLDRPPAKLGMVASHIYDLRAATANGMKSIYIRRVTEDPEEVRNSVKTKAEGGEVDIVVDTFTELAEILAHQK